MRTAIIGGGAAGFFLAINLKEMMPEMEVTIFEKSKKVLAKVEISGGGRCNCTNSFESVRDLSQVYPRGHRLMKRLFKTFNYRDAYQWFENKPADTISTSVRKTKSLPSTNSQITIIRLSPPVVLRQAQQPYYPRSLSLSKGLSKVYLHSLHFPSQTRHYAP